MLIEDYLITDRTSVREAVQLIDENGRGIAFVCNQYCLLGALSDGDIRRYILHNGDLEAPVSEVANYNVHFLYKREQSAVDMRKYFEEKRITAVPIVDEQKRIMQIVFENEESVYFQKKLNLPVVIMAGGKGTRLYPYTEILPKPLIPIGEKTITEHIMERFSRFGCNEIKMIVNYKKKFIETYFSEEESGYHIDFVEEQQFMGTGGGLQLLQGMDRTFFMTNCDIIVEADYEDIIEKHRSQHNIITLVCARKVLDIPYGTVEINQDGYIKELKEKPSFSFLTNTGFYIIEPEFLEMIPKDTFIHITDVIQHCIAQGKNVGVYTIEEEAWMDMGQMSELDKMKKKIGGKDEI